jgi:hypothetical protein
MLAFSKESLLKPVLIPPVNRLVPVPPPQSLPLEETKGETIKHKRVTIEDTPTSVGSKSTHSSDNISAEQQRHLNSS